MRQFLFFTVVSCLMAFAVVGCSGEKANTVIIPDAAQDSRVQSYATQDPSQYSDRAAGTKNRP